MGETINFVNYIIQKIANIKLKIETLKKGL